MHATKRGSCRLSSYKQQTIFLFFWIVIFFLNFIRKCFHKNSKKKNLFKLYCSEELKKRQKNPQTNRKRRWVQRTRRRVSMREEEVAKGAGGGREGGRCATISCSCMLIWVFQPSSLEFTCHREEHRRSWAEQDAGDQMCGRRRWVRQLFFLHFSCLNLGYLRGLYQPRFRSLDGDDRPWA